MGDGKRGCDEKQQRCRKGEGRVSEWAFGIEFLPLGSCILRWLRMEEEGEEG